MALKEVNRGIKKPAWIDKINWLAVRVVVVASIVITMIGTGAYFALERPNWPDYEQIIKVEVGMKKQEVFDILGEKGWDEYDENGFDYYWRFKAPSGKEKTFWVTMKDGVVIDIYTD